MWQIVKYEIGLKVHKWSNMVSAEYCIGPNYSKHKLGCYF